MQAVKLLGYRLQRKTKNYMQREVTLRTYIVDLMSTRRQYRRSRRNRTTRHRKPQFNNRVRSKNKGWLVPSVEQKINIHVLLPVTGTIVEVASFDIQRIKNPSISGEEYQKSEQLDFWNIREYVLFRDGHKCQHCKGKSKNKILNVHHIESRKTGGDAPNNLITLCETCHANHHDGKIQLKVKRGQSFKDVAFMGVMRRAFYNRLKEMYPSVKQMYI